MTTCAISECRNEGVLLLHIRHRKENLLQAEYCPEHFCSLAQQWIEDIHIANYTKKRLHRDNINRFSTTHDSIADALDYVWSLKKSVPKNTTIEEIFQQHDVLQHEYERIISNHEIQDKDGMTLPIILDHRTMIPGKWGPFK